MTSVYLRGSQHPQLLIRGQQPLLSALAQAAHEVSLLILWKLLNQYYQGFVGDRQLDSHCSISSTRLTVHPPL